MDGNKLQSPRRSDSRKSLKVNKELRDSIKQQKTREESQPVNA